ncbi:MAG TPA: DUF5317 domain-containing protein [Armatimonadota bacterium]|jgi:hypothetical protein
MVLIEAIIISILAGLIRGGKFRNLERIPLQYVYLFVASVSIYIITACIAIRGGREDLVHYARIANIVQYIGLLAAIGLNVKSIREMWVVGVGTLCNFLPIAANGGVMPMSPAALTSAGMPQLLNPQGLPHMVRHTVMSPSTHLKPLADIIPIGPFSFLPYRLANILQEVASVGDILVALAIFVLIQRYMCHDSSVVKESIA